MKSILKNVKQLFFVVFSVVLGILLSERIEERKSEREAEFLLSKIKLEVSGNRKMLAQWVPYHKEIVHRLDSLHDNETFIKNFIEDASTLYEEVITRGTLMGRSPTNDAWDIAKSHPLIVHLEYEDLLIISKVYNQQAITYNSVPKIVELLLAVDFNAEENARKNLHLFRNLIREVVSREIQLMSYLEEAKVILEL